jgi:hypothetical protein
MMAEDPNKRPSAEEILRSTAALTSKTGLPLSSNSNASGSSQQQQQQGNRRSL